MYLEESCNYYIVTLSVGIAIFVSYFALSIATKISRGNGRSRLFWLLAGSFVMGSGVWSMHFVGMLAMHFQMPVKYDVKLTLLSMFASMISSFIAFYITKEQDINSYKIVIGGFVMGSGIAIMHYMGMEAMIMPAEISYDKFWLILSVLIAFIVSFAALLLFLHFRNQSPFSWLSLLPAFIMGFAINGMHYTGMKATRFHHHAGVVMEHESTANLFLLYGVTITIFIILLVSFGAVFFDWHVLEKMAFQDRITGLPNRNQMNRFFDTYAGNEKLGVLFLDLDHFKAINDTLGHHTGDLLIKQVGLRLCKFINKDQQAFRIGGDEFLVIVKKCDQKRATRLAEEILQSIKEVYCIDGNELYISASIGISISSIQDSDRSMLLKTADTAMYQAKGLGKNQYYVYDEKMGMKEVENGIGKRSSEGA